MSEARSKALRRRQTDPPSLDSAIASAQESLRTDVTHLQPAPGVPGTLEGPPRGVTLRPQDNRRFWIKWSALIGVILPTLLAAIYYNLWASDIYAVEARFAVRSNATAGAGDSLGILAGLPSTSSAVADSYIVIDHMLSRELIDKLEKQIGIRTLYARPEADYLARWNNNNSAEKFLDYWRTMVKANYDGAAQLVTAEIKAFTREDAKLIAEHVLKLSEELINDLSSRARTDSVRSAQQEVDRLEQKLKANRLALRAFRDTQQEFDPLKKAESRYALLASLEQELSKAKARLASLRAFMGENAPSVTVLNSEIAALQKQVAEERAKLGSDVAPGSEKKGGQDGKADVGTLGGLVANYEELLVDREFSEKAYLSALASLERARVEADRQQRYLATFVRPILPDQALYPKRILSTLTVAIVAVILWSLGVLIVYAVRDHAL